MYHDTVTDKRIIGHVDNVMWSMYHDVYKGENHDINKNHDMNRD
jgi:hypothetical protein